MKAIFMTETSAGLMEVERREIEPTMNYHKTIREPLDVKIVAEGATYTSPVRAKTEHWICRSKPVGLNDFAVFMLQGVE